MTESELWHYLSAGLPEVHWSRIEPAGVAVGVFDINGCWQGQETWIELKVGGAELRPSQKAWGMGRNRAGGNLWIINWSKPPLGGRAGRLDLYTFHDAIVLDRYNRNPTTTYALPVTNWTYLRYRLFWRHNEISRKRTS